MNSRREFLQQSIGAGLVVVAGAAAVAPAFARDNDNSGRAKAKPGAAPNAAGGQLNILILGGTGFLGPACTEAALARGHKVTLFNRGRLEERRKVANRPSAVPEGVEVLYGNRDPEKHAEDWKDDARQNPDGKMQKKEGSPKGLSQLEGKSWDAVIDTSGYWPRIVNASATLLAPKVKQYVFISTLSVYKDTSKPVDETGETGVLADPKTEEFGADFSNYGPGKAACEAAAEAAMPGRVTNLRPGFIVGARDNSKRFMYWPVRASQGGEMIVPGKQDDPIQVVDVRDLAEFTIRCIENNIVGVYNITGPSQPHSMEAFVDGCISGVGSDAKPVWLPAEFLTKNGVEPGAQFPLWIEPVGEGAGFHRCSVEKAVAAGLAFRPLPDTAKYTLDWCNSLPEDLRAGMIPPMLKPEREAELIALFRAPK